MSASSTAIQIMLNSGYYDPCNNCLESRKKSDDIESGTIIYGTSPRILLSHMQVDANSMQVDANSMQSITKAVHNMSIQ
jgi:hypothetical protein